MVFDGLYIYTSLKEGVWADGIDLYGCKEVSIANCAVETGDDYVAISSDPFTLNLTRPLRADELQAQVSRARTIRERVAVRQDHSGNRLKSGR